MKRYILTIALMFVGIVSTAQFTLVNEETGAQINDGDIINITADRFTTHVIITNTNTSAINMYLEVMDIVNTNGSELSLCFAITQGQCYLGVNIGDIKNAGTLAAGASTSSDNFDFMHVEGGFDQNNPVNFTTFPKDYVVKLYATDGAVQIGTPITFTYRITSAVSAEEFSKDNSLTLFVNAQRQLVVNTNDKINFAMYNLTGQQVINTTLSQGIHRLSVTKLPTGIYMVYAKSGTKQIYRKVVIQ